MHLSQRKKLNLKLADVLQQGLALEFKLNDNGKYEHKMDYCGSYDYHFEELMAEVWVRLYLQGCRMSLY
jgi:hypothetical protein